MLILPSDKSPYPSLLLASHLTLLKAYLATCAAWYISWGNGQMPLKECYAATNNHLTAPPAVRALPDAQHKPLKAPSGPWEHIVANAVMHPEEHLPKAVG